MMTPFLSLDFCSIGETLGARIGYRRELNLTRDLLFIHSVNGDGWGFQLD